jgi:hypothetical protein
MFWYDDYSGGESVFCLVGFHLGIPLASCQTARSVGWDEIRQELAETLVSRRDQFEASSFDHEAETRFPLGRPIAIRYRPFFQVFNLAGFLSQKQLLPPWSECNLDHLIWICPSGVVMLMIRMCVSDASVDVDLLNQEIMRQHYAELSYIFTEIAEVVDALLPETVLQSALCSVDAIAAQQACIALRKSHSPMIASDMSAGEAVVFEFFEHDPAARTQFEEILLDVYYIKMTVQQDVETMSIGYFKSEISSTNRQFPFIISSVYSSFVGFLWIMRHLGEQALTLQRALIGALPFSRGVASELKLYRIFCLRLINESRPMSIRLTTEYMSCMEAFWTASRVNLLVDQISEQIETLDAMLDWAEAAHKEARNMKIGLVAIFLALLSTTAVAAQIVSTVDVSAQLGMHWRILSILIGFSLGVLSTIGIYLLPVGEWVVRFRSHKRSRHSRTMTSPR